MKNRDYEKEIRTVIFKLEELMRSINSRLQALDEDENDAYLFGKLDGVTMAYIILRKQIDGEDFDE